MVSPDLSAELVSQPCVQRGVGAGGGLAAAERLARVEPGARRDLFAHREPLVARQLGARMLRGERARRALQLFRRLDLEARLPRLGQGGLEALRAAVVLEELAVAVEPSLLLEVPHAAAQDHRAPRGTPAPPREPRRTSRSDSTPKWVDRSAGARCSIRRLRRLYEGGARSPRDPPTALAPEPMFS